MVNFDLVCWTSRYPAFKGAYTHRRFNTTWILLMSFHDESASSFLIVCHYQFRFNHSHFSPPLWFHLCWTLSLSLKKCWMGKLMSVTTMATAWIWLCQLQTEVSTKCHCFGTTQRKLSHRFCMNLSCIRKFEMMDGAKWRRSVWIMNESTEKERYSVILNN